MWPRALVEELAARRCIIFLGAGASAGCVTGGDNPTSPPTWSQLLDGLKDIARDKDSLPIVDDLMAKEKFLDAAEVLFGSTNPADFSAYIREVMAEPRYKQSSTHESVLSALKCHPPLKSSHSGPFGLRGHFFKILQSY